jgi:two-component system, OmpR family, sensor histidine kinase KdpD
MRWFRRLARHGYMLAVFAVAVSTVVFLPGRDTFAKGQWALFYLLVILLVASAAGVWPAVLAAALAFLAWNFFFLPPYHTFQIRDSKDWLSLVAFLIVGVLVGVMAGRMREREERAVARELEAVTINRVSTDLVSQTSTPVMAQTVVREAVEQLEAPGATLFLEEDGELEAYCSWPPHAVPLARTVEQAEEAFAAARRGAHSATGGRNGAEHGLSVPLRSPSGVFGVLSLGARKGSDPFNSAEIRLVTSLANLVAAFLERQDLQTKATQAEAGREADRLKSSLLSSVSHELKTPLAALAATVSNLLESDVHWDEAAMREELQAIVTDITRLNNSVGSLLDLSRLETGSWEPRRELYDLSDIVATGIEGLPAHERSRVVVDIPDDLEPLRVDYSQWTRVLRNLLENATLYAGPQGRVTVGARQTHRALRVWVEDEGPGVPPDEHAAVFEKFYRGRTAGAAAPSGTGLGLAITREIVRAHGGTVQVEDVVPHGARFVITLSVDDAEEVR